VTEQKDRKQFANLLEEIEARPAMFLGQKSLTRFYAFLDGYGTALHVYSIDSDLRKSIPREFHDWVAYREHFEESTSGWCNMILANTSDEEKALERCFQLLREYHARKPVPVARLLNASRPSLRGFTKETYKTDLTEAWHRLKLGEQPELPPGVVAEWSPSTLLLVTYTEDPGFFVRYEGEEQQPFPTFCPDLRIFEYLFQASRGDLEIINKEIFERIAAYERPKGAR